MDAVRRAAIFYVASFQMHDNFIIAVLHGDENQARQSLPSTWGDAGDKDTGCYPTGTQRLGGTKALAHRTWP